MDNALKSWSTTLVVNTDKENTIDKVILPNSGILIYIDTLIYYYYYIFILQY